MLLPNESYSESRSKDCSIGQTPPRRPVPAFHDALILVAPVVSLFCTTALARTAHTGGATSQELFTFGPDARRQLILVVELVSDTAMGSFCFYLPSTYNEGLNTTMYAILRVCSSGVPRGPLLLSTRISPSLSNLKWSSCGV